MLTAMVKQCFNQHAICFQFPITALREIRILQLLKHENVVNLLEICRTKGTDEITAEEGDLFPTYLRDPL